MVSRRDFSKALLAGMLAYGVPAVMPANGLAKIEAVAENLKHTKAGTPYVLNSDGSILYDGKHVLKFDEKKHKKLFRVLDKIRNNARKFYDLASPVPLVQGNENRSVKNEYAMIARNGYAGLDGTFAAIIAHEWIGHQNLNRPYHAKDDREGVGSEHICQSLEIAIMKAIDHNPGMILEQEKSLKKEYGRVLSEDEVYNFLKLGHAYNNPIRK